jgi:BirA family transcriptional regulator, biotin operon repressor / biotin---[acetyl-CoA-carboxylase] ligase
MRLDPAAVAAGFRLAAHDTLGSTNVEALRLARSGEQDATWVTARRQSAGRGRRGNEWVSEPGNLYATLLLADPSPAELAPELSFVTGLAVHDALAACAAPLRDHLALKWPNDVLCGGKKLSGILIEGEAVQGRLAVAIGIGINCASHPAQTAFPATDLAAEGVAAAAEDVFSALSGAMVRRLGQWNRGANFATIRADWMAHAAGIGGDMHVRLPGAELFGRCEALDERGRLLLRLADGSVQTITAGDVFPVAAARQGAH